MPVRESLTQVATRVLAADPSASLSEVARAAGMSRTSLHARHPSRLDLLVTLAHRAMDLIEDAYAEADLDVEEDVEKVLHRLVGLLLPIAARVEFLLRERSLNGVAEVSSRYALLDEPLHAWVAAAQARGALEPAVPTWWVAATLLSSVITAHEYVAGGYLAPRDAPALVLRTVLGGVGPR